MGSRGRTWLTSDNPLIRASPRAVREGKGERGRGREGGERGIKG